MSPKLRGKGHRRRLISGSSDHRRWQSTAFTHWGLDVRLTSPQITAIRAGAAQLAGEAARVWLFGSRVRDDAKGGDVDLLLELDETVAEPAQLSAQLAARVSRAMDGRKVDVLIKAPNLQFLPIHAVALAEGIRL